MACCDNHDRLDKQLTTEEFTGQACGSERKQYVDSKGVPSKASGPEYCCPECPTLREKILGSAPAQV